MTDFPPTRDAALKRLDAFLPRAGFSYATRRNYDAPDTVSRLSPYLRHRVMTEPEVLRAVLTQHTPKEAEKFIAEVCWRTYWKGVLELRPALWTQYQADLNGAWNMVQTNAGLRQDWEAACKGETGIDCFDIWANELTSTGYLHNHARMWFASIWIFTLRLPWTLGADFFMRHLLDGDPAANTLSWRWVGGLQTKGKTYLARPDNIAKFTNGRFNPTGLATSAPPLEGPDLPQLQPAPISDPLPRHGQKGLLITQEDLCPDDRALDTAAAFALLGAQSQHGPLLTAEAVHKFKQDCIADAGRRLPMTATNVPTADAVVDWARANDLSSVMMAYVPTGPVSLIVADLRTKLAQHDIVLSCQIRPYDQTAWPSATHGFFRFKDVIPKLLSGCA